MKVYLLIICLCRSGGYLAGQTSGPLATQKEHRKIDSLLLRLPSANRSDQGFIYEKLAFAYLSLNNDSAITFVEKASGIFTEIKNDTALFNLNLFFAKKLLDFETDRSLPYFWKAKSMKSAAVGSAKYQYKLNAEMSAMHYFFLSNYDSSLYYDKQCLALASDSLEKGKTLAGMGLNYNALGMTVKALDAYLKAMSLLENKGDALALGGLYNNLGILYEDDENNAKAELYYKKAYEMFKKSGDLLRQFSALNNLGILYSHEARHEESLQALSEAEKIHPQLGSKANEAIVNLNVGNTLVHMGRSQEALTRFKIAMKLFVEVGHNYGLTACHRQMGEAYYETGQYKMCEREEQMAITLAKKYGYIYLIRDAYKDLADMYATVRQYEKAHFHLNRYHELNDSLTTRDRASKLGLLEKEYELAKQEEEKKLLVDQQEASVAQARIDRVTKLSLGSGLAFVAIASFVTLVAYRRTKAKNQLLAAQKEKILQQSEALEEASNARSRFFANVSHELRTPVTLITGMLEVLHEKLGKNSHSILDIALNNSRKLQTLVNEVLDLTLAENTAATLTLAEKEIGPLLRRVLAAFDSLLQKKSISLTCDTATVEGLSLAVDEGKFEKIINNLIFNAVKFNHEGGRIVVSATHDDNLHSIVIRVTDTGTGIPAEDIPHIFDRFYQSAAGRQNNAGGVGIGLSLVKELTEMHGGSVSVQSNVGEGTTFEIRLPIVKLEGEVEEPGYLHDEPVVNLEGFDKAPAVLVVEDNEEMQFYIKEVFGGQAKMSFANNGLEALNWLEKNSVDVIISDVMMPEMDGYELLRNLKQSETLKRIPVVMLTARAAEEDLLHGLSLGVDDYLTKPFSGKELKVRVHNLLTNLEIRKQWQSKPVEPGEVEVEPSENEIFIQKVEAFVHAHVKNAALGISGLADHLAMSERQLYRRCGLLTGMSPAQLIKEVRLQLAYKMLINKEVFKVSDLAARIGFEDSTYFSRQFHERFGKRPSEML